MLIWGSIQAIYVYRNDLTRFCKDELICPSGHPAEFPELEDHGRDADRGKIYE